MSQDKTSTPFPTIVAELRELCEAERSGTLYIMTDDNRLAQASLNNGEIVSLFCQNKRGADALPLMLKIKAGRHHFKAGPVSRSDASLPSTGEVLRTLNAAENRHVAGISTSDARTAPAGLGVSDETRATLEETLAEYIGPVAAVICPEHLAKAPDLESALHALAGEIPDPTRAQQFMEDVLEKI